MYEKPSNNNEFKKNNAEIMNFGRMLPFLPPKKWGLERLGLR
jgi:hypothetical protein